MTDKMGEGIIQSAFADHFSRISIAQFGIGVSYVSANFQGKNDKQFADYFASINSQCMLVEFKEFEKEFMSETKKPLRDDLCSLLIEPIYSELENLAARGHFLACGDIHQKIENIYSYPKKVCPLFEVNYNFSGSSYTEREFLSEFVVGNIGISIEEMNSYVALLAQIAEQGNKQSGCPEFKALLLSYDSDASDYKKQPFNDLCELGEIMKMAISYITHNKPSTPKF